MSKRKVRTGTNQQRLFAVPTRYTGPVSSAERDAALEGLSEMAKTFRRKRRSCPSCNFVGVMTAVNDYYVCPSCNTHCHHI